VTSGVPQGSILGPLLFIVFTNDISKLVDDCCLSFYVDDLKIYKTIDNNDDCTILQNGINKLFDWCQKNGMVLNIKKCASMTFSRKKTNNIKYDYSINDVKLDDVNSIRDLGVIIDSKLTFVNHIDRMTSSARSVLGFVKRRVKDFDDPYICKTLYCALVQPILEYASVVWSPHHKIYSDKIESVQKQFLLFALRGLGFSGFQLPAYKSRLVLLDLTTLEKRRENASATFIFDLIRQNVDSEILSKRIKFNDNVFNVRNRKLLKEEYYDQDYTRNDPVARGIRIFNENKDCYDTLVTRDGYKSRLDRKCKKIFIN
jgi:hypothetical protein